MDTKGRPLDQVRRIAKKYKSYLVPGAVVVILIALFAGNYLFSRFGMLSDKAALKNAINNYYRTTYEMRHPDCTGIRDGDYTMEASDLNGDGINEYIVTIGSYCGEPVRAPSGGYGPFLVIQKSEDSYRNIGVVEGSNYAVDEPLIDGYKSIYTSEKHDAADFGITEWHFNNGASAYKQADAGFSLVVESPVGEVFTYRFYAGNSYPFPKSALMAEVTTTVPGTTIPTIGSLGIGDGEYFRKDIDGDGFPEIFVKVKPADTSSTALYKVLRFENGGLIVVDDLASLESFAPKSASTTQLSADSSPLKYEKNTPLSPEVIRMNLQRDDVPDKIIQILLDTYVADSWYPTFLTSGDINNDSRADFVFFVEDTFNKHKTDKFSDDKDRMLLVLLSEQDGSYKVIGDLPFRLGCGECGGAYYGSPQVDATIVSTSSTLSLRETQGSPDYMHSYSSDFLYQNGRWLKTKEVSNEYTIYDETLPGHTVETNYTYTPIGNSEYSVSSSTTVTPSLADKGFDVATFVELDPDGYLVKDRNGVYFQGDQPLSEWPNKNDPIIGADVTTFVSVDSFYGKDKNSVYFGDTRIPGADPTTFEILFEPNGFKRYTKDKNSVYYVARPVIGADATTFTILGNDYAKDKNSVYNAGKVIPGADPATFVAPRSQ